MAVYSVERKAAEMDTATAEKRAARKAEKRVARKAELTVSSMAAWMAKT